MIGLDSNVVVRYIAQDDKKQSPIATRLIEQDLTESRPGYLSLPALAEVIWVMVSCYNADRKAVIQMVEVLLAAPQLRVQMAEQVWQALSAYEAGSLDFSDALIAAVDQAEGCQVTRTFDRTAARAPGFELLG
ncbi:MAG: type II toxin-antitoxin system VapC family toxin [Proteobacteria bacterium]|nr:type II toxin-antitoxin system VapC family toxin [Pseudomonadota bacterium]